MRIQTKSERQTRNEPKLVAEARYFIGQAKFSYYAGGQLKTEDGPFSSDTVMLVKHADSFKKAGRLGRAARIGVAGAAVLETGLAIKCAIKCSSQ